MKKNLCQCWKKYGQYIPKIFKIDQMSNFAEEDKEIQFLFPKYNQDELNQKVLEMNEKDYWDSVAKNNTFLLNLSQG